MRKKKISPEDQEVLLALNILKTTMEGVMKTIAEEVQEVKDLKAKVAGLIEGQNTYFAKVLDAFNRLEAKIAAAGGDAQPIADEIAPIKQLITDAQTALETKAAEADITGV